MNLKTVSSSLSNSGQGQYKFSGSTNKIYSQDDIVKQIEIQYECIKNYCTQQSHDHNHDNTNNNNNNNQSDSEPTIECSVIKNTYQTSTENYYKNNNNELGIFSSSSSLIRPSFKLIKSERFYKLTLEEMKKKFDIVISAGGRIGGNGSEANDPMFHDFLNHSKLFDSMSTRFGKSMTHDNSKAKHVYFYNQFDRDDFNEAIFGNETNENQCNK